MLALVGLMVLLFPVSYALAQDEDERIELRFKFTEGQDLTVASKSRITLTMDEVPEMFGGMLEEGEDFLDIKFEMTLDMKVTKVKDGTATLEGKVKTLTVTGPMMFDELEYEYDAENAEEEEDPEEEAPDDGMGPPMGFDFEQMLDDFVKENIKIKIDRLGKVEVIEPKPAEGGRGGMMGGFGGSMGNQLFNLNGLMGELPKEKVAEGETWQSTSDFGVPGVPVKAKMKIENKFKEIDEVDGLEVAVIKSTMTIASEEKKEEKKEGEEDPGPAPGFNLDLKVTGEGKGKTFFAIEKGRVVKTDHELKANVEATMENPATGEDMDLKSTLRFTQENAFEEKSTPTEDEDKDY
jgi:hypothetical protein